MYLRDAGDTEIGGFGIAHAEDLLLIEDIQTVTQKATEVTVAFDDSAVADFFGDQVEQGRRPEQFARVWIHTHPGDSANPSGTDEETFARVFGSCDWAIMFILAQGGKTYCRLRFNVGPGGATTLPVEIDYGEPFAGSDPASWLTEYERNVQEEAFSPSLGMREEFFGMHHSSRQRVRGFCGADGESVPDREERLQDAVQEDLQEMLLSEYAEYWGAEREVVE